MSGEERVTGGHQLPLPGLDGKRSEILHDAAQHVDATGLSLGIDSPLIEKLSHDASITSSQFAEIWPSQKAFISDLYCEMGNDAKADRADTETLLFTWQYLSTHIEDLRSHEGRRRLLTGIIRTVAAYNFEAVTGSSKWRTYAALSMTIMSWDENDARRDLLDALRESELSFLDTMESFYRNVLPTVGYHLKPVFNNDYQPFVVASASVIEGLGIVRSTVPALVETQFDLPTDDGAEPWSVVSLAFMGVVDVFIEPDPSFVPEESIARLSTGMDVSPKPQSESATGY